MKSKASKTGAKSKGQYKDIVIAFLTDSIAGVERFVDKHKTNASVVVRAIHDLEQRTGTTPDILMRWAKTRYGQRIGQKNGRGRVQPTIGSSRKYKAQALKKGGAFGHAFLRLPLIDARKEDSVEVTFHDEHRYSVVNRSALERLQKTRKAS
jgi:hypothetical protein